VSGRFELIFELMTAQLLDIGHEQITVAPTARPVGLIRGCHMRHIVPCGGRRKFYLSFLCTE
jgi:hypothetical protein